MRVRARTVARTFDHFSGPLLAGGFIPWAIAGSWFPPSRSPLSGVTGPAILRWTVAARVAGLIPRVRPLSLSGLQTASATDPAGATVPRLWVRFVSWAHRRLNQAQWARVRRAALRRAGFRCQSCGRPGRLEVHHCDSLEAGGAPYDPGNLEALCFACHRDRHQDDRAQEVPGRAAWLEELRNGFAR